MVAWLEFRRVLFRSERTVGSREVDHGASLIAWRGSWDACRGVSVAARICSTATPAPTVQTPAHPQPLAAIGTAAEPRAPPAKYAVMYADVMRDRASPGSA